MNVRIPNTTAEWEAFVKENVWTIAIVLFCLIAAWQGLTLYTQMRSWRDLQAKVQTLVMKDATSGKEKENSSKEKEGRSISETFFFRPSSNYQLTAIFDDRALINGREVKVGDTIEKAVVEKIEVNAVTLKEEGSADSKRIELHPGL